MNGNVSSTTPPRKFILFSKGRTASNLLVRILNLNEQPSLLQGEPYDYYFLDVMMARRNWSNDDPTAWTKEEKQKTMKDFQSCFDNFHGHVQRAEAQDKAVWVKEHLNVIELKRPQSFTRRLFTLWNAENTTRELDSSQSVPTRPSPQSES